MSAALKILGVSRFKKIAVIGFGLTGQSVMRFFADSTAELIAMDTREFAPNKQELQTLFPQARLVTGGLDQRTLETADLVVVSPGVGVDDLMLDEKVGKQTRVLGDIQLFMQYASVPILAITGSNGKSTVATLVDLMINASGNTALLGGNIGPPALDLLSEATPDFYVLEVSSFQLDTTTALNAEVAVVLNISEDHLDRYPSYADYVMSKNSVYKGAHYEVVNRDEETAPRIVSPSTVSFGLDMPANPSDFGIANLGDNVADSVVFVKGDQRLVESSKFKLKGKQNWLNILAAMAIVDQAGIALTQGVIQAACNFGGLPHRCEQVVVKRGVTWINDSKGTNVGATIAAISAISENKILILGGQGKGVDFGALRAVIDDTCQHAIIFGQDAPLILSALDDVIDFTLVDDLEHAVALANELSIAGDVVLFSPACASLDTFKNFMVRGEAFKQAVLTLSPGIAKWLK